jgi:hypothetical protein
MSGHAQPQQVVPKKACDPRTVSVFNSLSAADVPRGTLSFARNDSGGMIVALWLDLLGLVHGPSGSV